MQEEVTRRVQPLRASYDRDSARCQIAQTYLCSWAEDPDPWSSLLTGLPIGEVPGLHLQLTRQPHSATSRQFVSDMLFRLANHTSSEEVSQIIGLVTILVSGPESSNTLTII